MIFTPRRDYAGAAARQSQLLKAAAAREHTLPAARFLYLASESSGRIVKAGMSKDPAKRMAALRVGYLLSPDDFNPEFFRLIWTLPLGSILRADAVRRELGLQHALRAVAGPRYRRDEWQRFGREVYPLTGPEAIRIAEAWATEGVHA